MRWPSVVPYCPSTVATLPLRARCIGSQFLWWRWWGWSQTRAPSLLCLVNVERLVRSFNWSVTVMGLCVGLRYILLSGADAGIRLVLLWLLVAPSFTAFYAFSSLSFSSCNSSCSPPPLSYSSFSSLSSLLLPSVCFLIHLIIFLLLLLDSLSVNPAMATSRRCRYCRCLFSPPYSLRVPPRSSVLLGSFSSFT